MRYVAPIKKQKISFAKRFAAFDERFEAERPFLYKAVTYTFGILSLAVALVLVLVLYAALHF